MMEIEREIQRLQAISSRRYRAVRDIRDEVEKAYGKLYQTRLLRDIGYSIHEMLVEDLEGFRMWAVFSRGGSIRWFGLLKGDRSLFEYGLCGKRMESECDMTFPWEEGDQDKALLAAFAEWVSSERMQKNRERLANLKRELGL